MTQQTSSAVHLIRDGQGDPLFGTTKETLRCYYFVRLSTAPTALTIRLTQSQDRRHRFTVAFSTTMTSRKLTITTIAVIHERGRNEMFQRYLLVDIWSGCILFDAVNGVDEFLVVHCWRDRLAIRHEPLSNQKFPLLMLPSQSSRSLTVFLASKQQQIFPCGFHQCNGELFRFTG